MKIKIEVYETIFVPSSCTYVEGELIHEEEREIADMPEMDAMIYGMGMLWYSDWAPGGDDHYAIIYMNNNIIWEDNI